MEEQYLQIMDAIPVTEVLTLTDLLGEYDWNRPNHIQKFGRDEHLANLAQKFHLNILRKISNHPKYTGPPIKFSIFFDWVTKRQQGRYGLKEGCPYLFGRLVWPLLFIIVNSDTNIRYH
jgi:hypothetical protein